MTTFVDTSAIYAVLDRSDQHHAKAKRLWEQLLDENHALVITNYVLVETLALVQRRLGTAAVRSLCTNMLPVFELHWLLPGEHHAALSAFLTAARRDLSFVDCTSFEAMRAQNIFDAFTMDPDFSEQGFTALA